MNTLDLKMLQYIYNYQREYFTTPTLLELKNFMKVTSDNSIVKRLARLHKLGFIDRCKGKVRMIKILDKGVDILTGL